MRVRPWPLVGALAVVIALAWWLRARTGDPTAGHDPTHRTGPDDRSRPMGGWVSASGGRVRPALRQPATGAAPGGPGTEAALPAAAVRFDARGRHSADPCSAPVAPSIPADYHQVTVGGVTVAWAVREPVTATDRPLRPVALAYLVAGLLDEAGELTGTEPRARLTVVIDASHDQFMERTGAPGWVAGLYDGGVVRLAGTGRDELGVSLATLRHEVMHAQLHVTVGCAPFWFDEGLAQYFADPPPVSAWLAMAAGREPIDLASVDDPAVFTLSSEEADRRYAVAFAMIVAALDDGGPAAVPVVVQAARAVGSPRDAAELWSRLYPDVDDRAVAERLAHKLFDLDPGHDLERALGGAICCTGLHDPDRVACRSAPSRSRPLWFDTSSTPSALCRDRW